MPITINGSGTVTGISAGGLPDDSIVTADIAAGAVTQAKRSEDLTLGTAQNSTSGTSIDFTGIPSWVKRVTVMFDGVSTNGTSDYLIQLGDSGGVQTTGYLGASSTLSAGVSSINSTAGFIHAQGSAANITHGSFVITNFNGNQWVCQGVCGRSSSAVTVTTAGSVTLSSTLTQLRITTVNGTNTFDAGSINILYE